MGTFFEVILEYFQSFFALLTNVFTWGHYIIQVITGAIPLITYLLGFLYPPIVMCAGIVIALALIKLIVSLIGIGIDIFV